MTALEEKFFSSRAANFWLYLKLNLALYLLFALVYGGTNYVASRRASVFHFYADWERDLPIVPELIYVYFSIAILFWFPLFFVDGKRFRRLAIAYAICILVAGLFFLMFPGVTAFAPQALTESGVGRIFEWLYRIDYPHNTVPSLHVALSTLTVLAIRRERPHPALAVAMLAWLGAICIAVILVHQHHFADVVGGLLLGWGCDRWYGRAPA